MGNVSESAIRDWLSQHLDVLEPGLRLVEVEHYLPSSVGAAGSVDILALDRFGNRVIIEIKRSDQAARQALHELHKYIALFGIVYGLRSHNVRCMIVSTTWHELSVPFAEFLRSTTHQVTGFEIDVASTGAITAIRRVVPANLPPALQLFRHHAIYEFASPETRAKTEERLFSSLISQGAKSNALVRLRYRGTNPMVVNPYLLYVVPGDLEENARLNILESLSDENESEEGEEFSQGQVEEEFQCRIYDSGDHGDYAIGYAEKFATLVNGDWEIESLIRQGRLASDVITTDEELVQKIKCLGGGNSVIFFRLSSPEIKKDWEDLKERAQYTLHGNPTWVKAFSEFCLRIEKEFPRASVAIKIYNPLMLLLTLYKTATQDPDLYLPQMELIATCEDSARAVMFLGALHWNTETTVRTLKDLLPAQCPDLLAYLLAFNMGVAWEFEEEICERSGLTYFVDQFTWQDHEWKKMPNSNPKASVGDFLAGNSEFTSSLIAEFGAKTFGI